MLRNLSEMRFQIIHEFCDSFGECFNVEDNYWNESGRLQLHRKNSESRVFDAEISCFSRLSVERAITVQSTPAYALTVVKLITPNGAWILDYMSICMKLPGFL